MSGVRVKTRTAMPAFPAGFSVERRRAGSVPLALAVGAAAAVLPFVVVPAWYDAYYWPKVCVLYAAVAVGAASLLRTERAMWLRDLGPSLGAALATWLASLTIATALSVNPLLSLVGEDYRYEGLLTWLAYGAAAALSARALQPPRRLHTILALALAGAGVMSGLALLQHLGFSPVPVDAMRRGWARAWATTGSPLALGAYVVLVLPLTLALYAASPPRRRLAYGALVIALYAAIVATAARAEWGALAVGVAAWAGTVGKAAVVRVARPLLVLAALCAAVTPAVLFTGPPGARDYAVDQGSAISRFFIWRTAAPLVISRPWFGWGPETLAQVYPAYGTPEFARVFPEAAAQRVIVDRPRSDLLQQAIAAGFVGLAAYVWLCVVVLRTAWRAARARPRGDYGLRRGDDRQSLLVDPQVIGAGLFGGFAAYLAQLQLSFSYVSVAPLFWILVGAVAALRPRVAKGGAQAFAGSPRRGPARV